MRSRIVTSGMAAAAAAVLLGLSVPAFAVDADSSGGGALEALEAFEGTTGDGGETDTLSAALDDVDEAVSATEEQVDATADEGPAPVSETVDTTTDTTTGTTKQTTDALRQAVGDTSDPTDPAGPDDTSRKDRRGVGGDAVASPDGSDVASGVGDGRAIADGGVPTPAPARFALDGFRRSGATSPSVAVTDDALFEPAPDLAPPTTREVIEPTVSAVPPLSLRAVAVEILVATALLVMATGGLLAELGPERG